MHLLFHLISLVTILFYDQNGSQILTNKPYIYLVVFLSYVLKVVMIHYHLKGVEWPYPLLNWFLKRWINYYQLLIVNIRCTFWWCVYFGMICYRVYHLFISTLWHRFCENIIRPLRLDSDFPPMIDILNIWDLQNPLNNYCARQLLIWIPPHRCILLYISSKSFWCGRMLKNIPSQIIAKTNEQLDIEKVVQPSVCCCLLLCPIPDRIIPIWIS